MAKLLCAALGLCLRWCLKAQRADPMEQENNAGYLKVGL